MDLTLSPLYSLLCHSPAQGLKVLRRLSLGGIEVDALRVGKVYLPTCLPKTGGLNVRCKRQKERCTNDWDEFGLARIALGR